MQQIYELKHEVGDAEMPASQHTDSCLVDLRTFTLSKEGVELQLDFVPPSKYEGWGGEVFFQNIKEFWVCQQCGKVYWEGTHHAAVRTRFSDLLDKRESDGLAYGTPG